MLRTLTTFLQKKLFVSLTIFIAMVALFYPQNAFAEYENYTGLFTPTSGVRVGSTVVDKTLDQGKGKVIGFNLRLNLKFQPFGGNVSLNEEDAKKKWDYVYDIQNGNNKVFLVRFCPQNSAGVVNDKDCWFHEVTYQEYAVVDETSGDIIGIASGETEAKKMFDGKMKWVAQSKTILDRAISNAIQSADVVTGFAAIRAALGWAVGKTDTAYPYPALAQKKWLPKAEEIRYITDFVDIKYNTLAAKEQGWYWFDPKGEINNTTLTFAYGNTYRIDIWYRGGAVENEKDSEGRPLNLGSTAILNERMRNFKSILETQQSSTNVPIIYFQIGDSITYTIPNNLQAAEQESVADNAQGQGSIAISGRGSSTPECSVSGGYFGGGTLMGCAAQLIYYLIYRPAAWFANIVGMLFDFFIGFSINDEAYRLEFIQNGWQVVRDFANIFFIIIMIYTGFAVALGFGKYSVKAVVGALIINALIINFSLFITRLGVDMSNILARVFYNQMTVDTTETGIGGYKPISVALISTFNPQKLMSADILTQEAPKAPSGPEEENKQDQTFDASGRAIVRESLNETNSAEYAAFFAIVSLASAVILFFVAKMFFSVAFIFVGRVVGLYIAMIFSPLAFLTRGNIPLIGNIGKINWKDWLDNYVKDISLPPIFMFFLYIIGFLMSSSLVTSLKLNAGASFFEKFVSVAIPMFIVYILIGKAKGVAEKYASETAKFVTEKIEGAGKFVGGLAVGGAVGLGAGALAMGGRGVGALASKLQKNSALGNTITQNLDKKGFGGTMARLANKGLTGAQKSSFDLRDNKIFGSGLSRFNKEMGIKTTGNNAVLGAIGFNQGDTKGGYQGKKEKENKKRQEKINKVETNFEDTDEGKKQAKAHYEEMQKKEFSKEEDGAKKAKFESENGEIAKRLNDKDNSIFKNEAEEELKAKKASGAITSYSIKDIEDLSKANKGEWEARNKSKIDEYNALKDSYEKFKKNQEKQYGKIKDNKTLTQALRLRYAENLMNETTIGDWAKMATGTVVGSAGVLMAPLTGGASLAATGLGAAIITDLEKTKRERNNANKKYLEDTQKKFKPDTQQEKELAYVKTALNSALKEMAQEDPKYKKFEKDGEYNHEDIKDYAELEDMITERQAYIEIKIKEAQGKITAATTNAKKVEHTLGKKKLEKEQKTLENALKRKADLEEKLKTAEEKKENKKTEDSKPKDGAKTK